MLFLIRTFKWSDFTINFCKLVGRNLLTIIKRVKQNINLHPYDADPFLSKPVSFFFY